MSLTSELAKFTPSDVQAKGAYYYHTGRVRRYAGDSDWANATVIGSSKYFVGLSWDENSDEPVLLMWCDCPYFEEHQSVCKHIWAVALHANSQRHLQSPHNQPIVAIEVDQELYDEATDDDEFQPFAGERLRSRAKTQKKSALQKPPKADWSRAFSKIRELGQRSHVDRMSDLAAAPRRQISYVIDLPTSNQVQSLQIECLVSERKKNGDWSKPRMYSLTDRDVDSLADPVDREIINRMLGAKSSGFYSSYENQVSRSLLRPRLYESILPLICSTGRCRVRRSHNEADQIVVQWDGSRVWRFAAVWSNSGDGKSFELAGVLQSSEETRPLQSADTVFLPGLVLIGDRLSLLDHGGLPDWLKYFQTNRPIVVGPKELDSFLVELSRLPSIPCREFPTDFQIERRTEPPKPRVVIRKPSNGWNPNTLNVELSFRYGDIDVVDKTAANVQLDPKNRTLVVRDRDAESAARTALIEAGVQYRSDYSGGSWNLNSSKLPKVVRTLIGSGWLVEAEGKLYRSAGNFEIAVSTNVDWFELEAKIDFDGQSVPLPRLLAAMRKGESIVRLDDGSFGLLPEEWLKKYGVFAEVGNAEGDKLRFAKTQVGIIDALLASQPEATFDIGFKKAREQLRKFDGIAPAKPSKAFHGDLRGYQREGLGWLQFIESFGWGGCLADDMGLGKTVQVLAMLADRATRRENDSPRTSLVVAPKSLLFNWKNEAARFAPHLKVIEHHAPDRGKDAAAFADADLVFTTYGIARKDAAMLSECQFDYCILDESQAIKNASTEQAKAVRLLKANHRLAMSGTPVENHLGELWSLFEFLNPGMLGAASVFRLSGAGARNPEPETRDLLAKALRPFILRRTKDQVAADLPAKTEQTVFCDLEPEQRKLYDELRDYYRTALLGRIAEVGMNKAKIMVLEALLRLRQAACHPGLIDKKKAGDSSAKLDVLLPQLNAVFEEGHKALVFSQFTSLLDIVKKRLDADTIPYEYLDGKTNDRQARVDRFQNDPDCKLFLISLKAGGVGLNLTAAEYVFLLDPWWNPAVEAQAIDRTHRIGQTRPVFAYRLIARNTVEEKVLELQSSKRALADAIINADNSLIGKLKKEDLELLLG